MKQITRCLDCGLRIVRTCHSMRYSGYPRLEKYAQHENCLGQNPEYWLRYRLFNEFDKKQWREFHEESKKRL